MSADWSRGALGDAPSLYEKGMANYSHEGIDENKQTKQK